MVSESNGHPLRLPSPGQLSRTASDLPREVVEKYGAPWTEPGNIWTNGPYVLKAWEHDGRKVMVKNLLYYQAESFHGAHQLDDVG